MSELRDDILVLVPWRKNNVAENITTCNRREYNQEMMWYNNSISIKDGVNFTQVTSFIIDV